MSPQPRLVLADTAYWIALANPRDQLHSRAAAASQNLHPSRVVIVTSDIVLTEFLDSFAGWGQYWRQVATRLVDGLQQNTGVVIEPQTRDLFNAALKRFKDRLDKGYSLTDCTSMVIMERLGIREILTGDRHFQQEGFTILL
jgi:predicted nucleic acid-binding protein